MRKIDYLTLSESELAELAEGVRAEVRRRTARANGADPLAAVKGQECAKRALIVAATGNHSLLLVGPSKTGKSMLRAAALELGMADVFEMRNCPCGNHGDPRRACRCTAKQIERHRGTLPRADITVEVPGVPQRDLDGPAGTGLAVVREQVAAAAKHTSLTLSLACANLLKAACNESGIDAAARDRILAVARTIANLDSSETIRPYHLYEAVNYRLIR